MNDTSTQFDWGSLGETWWLETARKVGATERHARFASRKHGGASNAAAARDAGFGTGAGARTEGYRLIRSNRVMQLLALATEESGAGYDGNMTPQERRQVLSQLGRSSDPQVKIKAVDSLNRMDERDRADALEAAARGEPASAVDTLKEIASLSPALAAQLAVAQGITSGIELTDADRTRIEQQHMESARDWIWKNPAQARQFLAMASMTNGSGKRAEDDHAAA
jgi:hypothetical protein